MPRQYTKAQQDSIDEQIADWMVNQIRPAAHVPSMTGAEQDKYAREVVDRLDLRKSLRT
jgi:hypothetical protein